MNYPKEFYYAQTQSAVECVNWNTGNLAVSELIAGKPSWIPPTLARKEKKKSLVIADWTAQAWSQSKIEQVKKKLDELIDAGFDIYFWQDGKITEKIEKVQLDTLNKQHIRQAMILTSTTDIINAASTQKQFTFDQVQVVDDYWLNHLLLGSENPEPRILRTSELPDLSVQIGKDLLNILSASSPPLTQIIHDEFSVTANMKANILKMLWDKPIVENYTVVSQNFEPNVKPTLPKILQDGYTLTLSAEQLKKIEILSLNSVKQTSILKSYLCLDEDSKLKTLNLYSCILSNEIISSDCFDLIDSGALEEGSKLNQLDELNITNSVSSLVILKSILKAAQNLKKLNMNRCKLDVTLNLDNLNLHQLEILDVSYTTLSSESIRSISTTATNLKKLNINGCIFDGTLHLENSTLHQLEELDAIATNLSLESLKSILRATTNLKKLNINRCKLDVTLNLDDLNLHQLEILDASNTNASLDSLKSILTAAPNLKKLIVNFCEFKGVLALENSTLHQLEELNLEKTTFPTEGLKSILTVATNLKTLNLRHCRLDGILNFDNLNLHRLEILDLTNTTLSLDQIKSILTAAPNLKKLKINDYKFIDTLNLENSTRYQLEELHAENSTLSSESLESFLTAAPNLKKLDLSRCTLNGALNLKNSTLNQLEELNLEKANLSLESLQSFLTAAPNLRKLDVSRYKFIGELALKNSTLNQLEELNLEKANLSLVSLKSFLTAATNLKILDISLCRFEGTINLKNSTLHQLKELKASSTILSLNSLGSILKSAPNLKKLDLCLGTFEGDLNLNNTMLHQLEELNLDETTLPIDSVKSILTATPNLKKLYLNIRDQNKISSELTLKANSLNELEELNIGNNLSVNSIKSLLEAAPKIKKLILSINDQDEIPGELKLKANSLNELVELKIGSYLSLNSLKSILEAAPNLNQESKNELEHLIINHPESKINNPRVTVPPHLKTDSQQPKHNPKKMKDYIPPTEFTFKGTNQSKSQGMIIDKLSQYLTLKKEHEIVISKIQKGICVALSHYFNQLKKEEWDNFIDMALDWDGTSPPSHELKKHFDELYGCIEKYQINQQPLVSYVGDNLSSLINTNTKKSLILANPWHRITLKPHENKNNVWYFYDPNHFAGALEIEKEELLPTIQNAIGFLVSVEASDTTPSINNPNLFIEHGGLISLCQCKNPDQMLKFLNQNINFSQENLEGLLLRTTTGVPAWRVGLLSNNPEIKTFTIELIKQFKLLNPEDADIKLADSLSGLTPKQKGEVITELVQADPKTIPKSLIATIRKTASLSSFEQKLRTWDTKRKEVSMPIKYLHHCLNDKKKTRLIELDSTQQIDTLRLQLEQFATVIHRPVFYIDKPEDLICSAPWIKKNKDQTGTLHKSPGGSLYQFLQDNKDRNPLLLVNYERFNADDLVRFNGLLDKVPNADGTLLPTKTQIIGFINRNKTNCYRGSDYYSRFSHVEHCPLTSTQLDELKSQRKIETVSVKEATIINLYHASNWEERLLGHWILDGDKLTFREGELIKAIEAGQPIQIQNGHWDDPAFQRFWQQALTLGVRHNDRIIKIPRQLSVSRPEQDQYAWQNIPTIQKGPCNNPNSEVLTPSSLSHFFARYQVSGTKLFSKPGFIEEAKNHKLIVEVTRSLNEDAWAMLMDECKKFNVQLEIYCSPGVKLPTAFNHEVIIESEPIMGLPDGIQEDLFISSTDSDSTISMLTRKNKNYTVIDISECTPADLLEKLDAKLNEEDDPPHFSFTQTDSVLTTELDKDKKIILKGYCSPELLDALSSEIHKRKHSSKPRGQIILVSDQQNIGSFMANRYQHQVIDDEKLQCLSEYDDVTIKRLEPYLKNEPLSKLITRARYWATNPQAPTSDEAWLGMNSLPPNIPTPFPSLDFKKSEQDSKDFTKNRLKQVDDVLQSSLYVFLTGLSGVGKSTFVEKELSKNSELYLTEERIEDWAKDQTSDKRKILFIDEANLSSRQWSEFEGLFNQPPSVRVNGKLYNLTKHHRVVFAGNPVNYGDERILAPFFQRHGNAVLFTPMPLAVINEEILKPVFENSSISPEHQQQIVGHILEVYAFIVNCSTTDVLITPRELQMMALLTIARAQSEPNLVKEFAIHFSYELAKNLVPKQQREAFDQRFKTTKPLIPVKTSDPEKTQFLITPSRQAISQQLNDLLILRKWRRSNEPKLLSAQLAGGLGGLINEGEPGIGKSELVIAALREQGFEEEHDYQKPSKKDNPFYRMPVSMPLKEKEDLLIKAFNEGAVVMIDEINSAPMMERLLNDLLMGKNPKANKEDKVKPGFMIIGTQNPVTMAGRHAPSTALKRRLITTELPEYQPDEIETILLSKGVDRDDAKTMIEAYLKNQAYARDNHLSPAPNFRNLMTLVDEHLNRLSNHNDDIRVLNEPPFMPKTPIIESHSDSNESDSRHEEPRGIKPDRIITRLYFNILKNSFKNMAFGGQDDMEMNKFLSACELEFNKAIENNDVQAISALDKKMTNVLKDLKGDCDVIKKIICDLYQQKDSRWCFWNIGSDIRARNIEKAMSSVPIEERAQLLSSKHPSINTVNEALAFHCMSFTNLINHKDKIITEKSVNYFKQFKNKFNVFVDREKDQVPTSNDLPPTFKN